MVTRPCLMAHNEHITQQHRAFTLRAKLGRPNPPLTLTLIAWSPSPPPAQE